MTRTPRTATSPLSKRAPRSMWVSATPRSAGFATMMTSPSDRGAWEILSLMSKILALRLLKQVAIKWN
jgi:hypothetical protein